VTVAERAPEVSGAKETPRVQLAFTAYAEAVQPFVRMKSPLFVPPRTTEEIWSGAPPEFVTVTFCPAVDVPCVTAAKERLVDDKETAGVVDGADVAMPLTWMDCGEFGASSVIEMIAERWPAARGVKVIVIVQPALAA